ncbi:MAG: aminodeoxychorismate lyase [Pseudomonadales bacterium]|nr:aminodeoxychorismate lyase [Pseudomonadales bacterium]
MTATLHAWFNGELIASPLEASSVASSSTFLLDRANTFGDGVFETMLVSNGKVPLLASHLQRLSYGLDRLGIECSIDLAQSDIDQALTTLSANSDSIDSENFIIKLVVSRGSSVFGYGSEGLAVNRLVLLNPYKTVNQQSCRLIVCNTKLGTQPAFAGIKHCNRLEQVLAKKEVELASCDDGLMLDQFDNIVETTSANLFILEAGQLVTPPISHCGVAGVMREYIIEQLDFPVSEEVVSLERLYNSDGCILTNSVRGVIIVSDCIKADGSIHAWAESEQLIALKQLVKSTIDAL